MTGITFVEDSAHPESWLRDVRLQWWDAAASVWRDGPYLLNVMVPYQEHVLPMIPSGSTVRDIIKA